MREQTATVTPVLSRPYRRAAWGYRVEAAVWPMKQRTYYLPVILPLVALAVGVAVQRALSFAWVEVLPPAFRVDRVAIAAAEAAARYQTVAMFVILFMTCLGVAGFAFVMTWRSTPKEKRIRLFVEIVAIAAVTFGLVVLLELGGRFARHDLGAGVFERTIGSYPFGGAMLGILDLLVLASNVAALGAAVVVAVAACWMAPPAIEDPDPGDIEALAADIAARLQRLKHLLFSAAILLVAGLFCMQAWRHWPAAFLTDDKVRETYLAIADASIQSEAALFVVILISAFLPVAMHLKAAGAKLADALVAADPAAAPARETWLKSRGLVLRPWERAQRIIAVVSPFLPAALPPLLEAVKGLFSG